MCGPGPVNLGGELTVRHSALLVVDDHAATTSDDSYSQRQTKHGWQSTFSPLLLFYPRPPPLLCNNTPNPAFESLDLFGSLESGRKSLFSTKILLKSPRRSGDLVRLSLQSSPLHVFYYNTHTSCDRQSLPFRTKPAQYSHTACGQVPIVEWAPAQGRISHITLCSGWYRKRTAASELLKDTDLDARKAKTTWYICTATKEKASTRT